MKRNIKIVLPAIVLLLMGSLQISAASNATSRGAFDYGNQTDVLFDGKVTSSFTNLGSGLCEQAGGYSFINWTETDSVKEHKIIFRINGNTHRTENLDNIKYKTGTIKGDNYNLYGKRENFFDPTTRIVGSWVV